MQSLAGKKSVTSAKLRLVLQPQPENRFYGICRHKKYDCKFVFSSSNHRMTRKRKTWVEKRDNGKEPIVKKLDTDFADMKAGEKMLIATPGLIDAYIRDIPKGKQSGIAQLRKDLAATWHADTTCPVTTGIFLRIVAEAAYEEWQVGKKLEKITPFWRMIPTDAPTAKKLSFGTAFLEKMRKKEGIKDAAPKKKSAMHR